MARIKSNNDRGEFDALHAESKCHDEDQDCGVKAIAVACNVEYRAAHAALKAAGRKDRKGCTVHQVWVAIESLGFKSVSICTREIIRSYPGVHKNLQSVTTHHPERFASVWAEMGACLLFSCDHVSALKDGKLHDWAVGRAKRALIIFQITKA